MRIIAKQQMITLVNSTANMTFDLPRITGHERLRGFDYDQPSM